MYNETNETRKKRLPALTEQAQTKQDSTKAELLRRINEMAINTQATNNIPLLPATTLTRPTPAAFKNGQTVTFITSTGETDEGTIECVSWMAATKVTTYFIKAGNKTHSVIAKDILPAKMPTERKLIMSRDGYPLGILDVDVEPNAHLMDEDTAPVLPSKEDLYQAMKAAEIVSNEYARLDTFDMPADHATYKRKVAAHVAFLRAQAAYTGVNNEGIIAYLYGAQKALQSTIESVSSPSQGIQVELSAVTPAAPQIPVVIDLGRKTGIVTFYDQAKGYGYIRSERDSIHFNLDGLYRRAMPITKGDSVSFEIVAQYGESHGRTRATNVLVDGWVEQPRPAYQASPALVADAKAADMPRKVARKAERAFKQERAQRNAASLKTLPKAK